MNGSPRRAHGTGSLETRTDKYGRDIYYGRFWMRHNGWVELEEEMLANIRAALDEHGAECCQSPKVILLHPGNHELIGWDEVLGLPVLPDPRVEPKKFLLVCGDRGWGGVHDGEKVWWTADGAPHRLELDDEPARAGDAGEAAA